MNPYLLTDKDTGRQLLVFDKDKEGNLRAAILSEIQQDDCDILTIKTTDLALNYQFSLKTMEI